MGIVAIVFSFVTIIVLAAMVSDHKEKRMKIEATLRLEELRRGYAPGTYSRSFSSHSAYKAMKRENKKWEKERKRNGSIFEEPRDLSDEEERLVIERGIKDLEERIKNLDTIMKEKESRDK